MHHDQVLLLLWESEYAITEVLVQVDAREKARTVFRAINAHADSLLVPFGTTLWNASYVAGAVLEACRHRCIAGGAPHKPPVSSAAGCIAPSHGLGALGLGVTLGLTIASSLHLHAFAYSS